MHIETEAKFEVKQEELETVRLKLAQLGALKLMGPNVEENQLFDFPDGSLGRSGCALRIRSYGDVNLLTFKGKIQADPVLKKREEIETTVQDLPAMRLILDRLGLGVHFSYSKTREIYRLKHGRADLQVCLDETPVGCFVEIEGESEGIQALAARFGWTEFIRKSYIEIYRERGL